MQYVVDAAVNVSILRICKYNRAAFLDGRQVDFVSSFLFARGSDESPRPLVNNDHKSFQGCVVVGSGFTFNDHDTKGKASAIETMRSICENSPECKEVIFPYIGGSEVNDHPVHMHHRYIINFGDMDLEEARRKYPLLISIVEERVKPERCNIKRMSNDQKKRAETWWQFARQAKDLYFYTQGKDFVLVTSQVSKYRGFAFKERSNVFDQRLIVLAINCKAGFCVVQSDLHDEWARFFGPTLEDRPTYTPTDCFQTFPFPSDWEDNETLEAVGKEYYEFRADLMVRNNEGLTKTYNRFHDPEESSPDILKLRELHAKMDCAVLDSYGWTDVPTDCEFLLDYEEDDEDEDSSSVRRKKKPWRYRWPDDVRDDVLARLLALNQERYEEEVRQGLHAKKGAKKVAKKARKRGRKPKTEKQPVVITAGADELAYPNGLRFPAPTADFYAINLITALLSARPEGLSWTLLRDAFVAATTPDIMRLHALTEDKQRVAQWAQQWKEAATPVHLIPALKTMSSGNLAIEGEGIGATFALQDGAKAPVTEFIAYDAWLALRIVEPLQVPLLKEEELEQLDQQLETVA